jgi:hypothetical protein
MRLIIDPLSAHRLRFESGAHGKVSRIEIEKGELSNVELSFEELGLHLSAGEATLVDGAVFEFGRTVRIPILSVAEGKLVVDDLVALFGGSADSPRTDAPSGPPERRPPPGRRFDFRFLDRLNGHLNVDLNLDVKVPLLGRRRGKHAFRVPIENGTINYRKLERNLSPLEDAVIDVELRDDRLILEKDIPLLPFNNKEILFWRLDSHEQELAQRRLVRLRTLLNYELPPTDPKEEAQEEDEDRDKDRTIPAVAAREVDVLLSLGGGDRIPLGDGWLRLGDEATPAVGELRLRGEAHYEGGHDLAPTQAYPILRAVSLGLEAIRLGTARVRADLFIGSIEEATVGFRVFLPNRLEARVRDLRLIDVSVELGAVLGGS